MINKELWEYILSQGYIPVGKPVFDMQNDKWTIPVREANIDDHETEFTVKLSWTENPSICFPSDPLQITKFEK